jgi:hypothetical protein
MFFISFSLNDLFTGLSPVWEVAGAGIEPATFRI